MNASKDPPFHVLDEEGSTDLLVIAGEASGDEHAAHLIEELLLRSPHLKVVSMGGPRLQEAGSSALYDLTDHAVVGIFEVLRNLSFFRRLMKKTVNWIRENQPKVVMLVDYPGFNLRLANALKDEGISRKGGGQVRVLQYVSPQLWAWKPQRRFLMERVLDGLGVLFPFEVKCYADVDLPVSFVGHPFVSQNYELPVRYLEDGPLLLLPGSRVQPVERILPPFLDAFEALSEDYPNLRAQIPVPDERLRKLVGSIVGRCPCADRVEVVEATEGLSARAALMSSGTMSFACALAGLPGVIAYKAHPITYWIGKCLVKIPHLGMANVLLPENPPYREFLQGAANGRNLSSELAQIIDQPNARADAIEVSGKLKDILTQEEGRGAVDWLIEAGSLE